MNEQRGFTILELMAIVAITATLVTLGVPNLQTLIFNNRITSQLNLFSSSLALARSEAVKVNQRVVVCPSTNGTTCDTTEDFDTGWLVFIDRSGTDFQVDDDGGGSPLDDPCSFKPLGYDNADDCILNYVPGLANDDMTLETNVPGNAIAYTGLGTAIDGNGAPNASGLFVICDSRGAPSARAVAVSTTGRTSVRTTQTDGNPLTCTP